MAVQRYISTGFWDDPWVQTLDKDEKLLYLYFMTNPLTNIAGVYEITHRRIIYDTGYSIQDISRIMNKYEHDRKAFYYENYVILPSWPSHQRWEIKETIKTGIESILKILPKNIRKKLIEIGYRYPMDRVPIAHPYRPCYTDTDTDTDSDPDKDTDSVLLTKKSYAQVTHKLFNLGKEAQEIEQREDSIPE